MNQTIAFVLLCSILAGCIPLDEGPVEPQALNQHTRLDRAPLAPEQRPDFISALALHRGTYRTAPDRIISESYPASMEDVMGSLPQSRCMWLGNDGAQREALRFHWEQVAYLSDEAIDVHELTTEVRTIGLCRINDPVTRQPPRRINGPENEYMEAEPRHVQRYGVDTIRFYSSHEVNFPRLLYDVDVYWGRLREFPLNDGGSLNVCKSEFNADPAGEVTITQGTLGYDGESRPSGGVSSCSGPFGRILFPERDARYEFWHADSDGSATHSHLFLPAIKIAQPGEILARLSQPSGTVRSWSTPRTGSAAHDVHWEENFSRRIQTVAVRFLTLNGTQREYLDLQNQRMCIVDPQVGSGCAWRCAPEGSTQGSVYRLRADGAGGPGCRLGDSAAGPPDHPAVTPTYDKARLCDREDPQCAPILEPLEWSIDAVAAGLGDVYVEFELEPVFEGMALRVAPTIARLGPVEIDHKAQAAFEIQNIGGVPIEVDTVAMDNHPGSVADFAARVLSGAQSFPLPLRMDEEGFSVEQGFDGRPVYALAEGERHMLVKRHARDGEILSIGDQDVQVDGAVLIRQNPAATLADPRLETAAYPVHGVSYSLRSVPFTLMPEERAEVLVNAIPRAHHGVDGSDTHVAWLRVEAANQIDPTERQSAAIPVLVKALYGPALNVFPPSLSLPLRNREGPGAYLAAAVIANHGDVAFDLLELKTAGQNQAFFSLRQPPTLPLQLAPGDSRLLEMEYLPNCDPLAALGHRAWLEIETSHQSLRVPLSGTPDCNLQLP